MPLIDAQFICLQIQTADSFLCDGDSLGLLEQLVAEEMGYA